MRRLTPEEARNEILDINYNDDVVLTEAFYNFVTKHEIFLVKIGLYLAGWAATFIPHKALQWLVAGYYAEIVALNPEVAAKFVSICRVPLDDLSGTEAGKHNIEIPKSILALQDSILEALEQEMKQ